MRRCPTAIRFAAALACAACSAGGHPSSSVGEGTLASDTSTSGPASDSIATAWESSDTETASTGSSSTTQSDATTENPDTESTAITDSTTDTPGTSGDESSSSGEPPMPVNLFDNPSLEEWTDASEPNTTPDGWDNCTIGGLAVDAVPDSCNGEPDVQDGARYARALGGEGLEQTVETVPGTIYRITFDYTAVTNCFGGGSNPRWEVLVNEDQILVTPNGPGIGWEQGDVTFAATQPMTTICFRKFENGEGGVDRLSVLEEL